MGKQTFHKIKNTIAILLVVIFLASLTAASVSADANAAFSGSISKSDCSDSSGTYTVKLNAIKEPSFTYSWDFGDDSSANNLKSNTYTHEYDDCTDHTITLTVHDSDDDTDDTYELTL